MATQAQLDQFNALVASGNYSAAGQLAASAGYSAADVAAYLGAPVEAVAPYVSPSSVATPAPSPAQVTTTGLMSTPSNATNVLPPSQAAPGAIGYTTPTSNGTLVKDSFTEDEMRLLMGPQYSQTSAPVTSRTTAPVDRELQIFNDLVSLGKGAEAYTYATGMLGFSPAQVASYVSQRYGLSPTEANAAVQAAGAQATQQGLLSGISHPFADFSGGVVMPGGTLDRGFLTGERSVVSSTVAKTTPDGTPAVYKVTYSDGTSQYEVNPSFAGAGEMNWKSIVPSTAGKITTGSWYDGDGRLMSPDTLGYVVDDPNSVTFEQYTPEGMESFWDAVKAAAPLALGAYGLSSWLQGIPLGGITPSTGGAGSAASSTTGLGSGSAGGLTLGGNTAAAGLGTGTSVAGLGTGTAASASLFTAPELMAAFPGAFPTLASATEFVTAASQIAKNPSLFTPAELVQKFPGAFPDIESANTFIKGTTTPAPNGTPTPTPTGTPTPAPTPSPTTTPTTPFDITNPSTYPWKDIVSTGAGLLGGYLNTQAAKDAAEAQAKAQIEAAKIAADAAKFRPVGVKTAFGQSQFGFDPTTGYLTSAGYTLSPELAAQRDKLMGMSTGLLTQAENMIGGVSPIFDAATRAGELGNQYLMTSPQEQAAKYMAEQKALYGATDERQLAALQNKLQQQGRLGLATGGTSTGMMAANPELEAFYNAQRQRDLQLAANATQGGMDYAKFGLGMVGSGADLAKTGLGLQTAAFDPYKATLGQAVYAEGLGQQAMEMGMNMGSTATAANRAAGGLLASGMQQAANTQGQVAQQAGSTWGNLLQGAGNALQNWTQPTQQQQAFKYDPYTGKLLGA